MYCPLCRSEYPEGWKRCPTDEAALLRASTIGKYKVDRLIGAGGMGAVYRAENPDTQSAVALKILHGSAAGVEAARTRFQREAAAVAALKTRHVVSIFDFGADVDGTLYLVMELLLGHNLRKEIASPPEAMPLPRVNLVFDGALRGLGAAHRAGIVHRDLKPENVFIAETDDGEVAKLLDFGIARKGGGSSLTHSGALMGTPAYMAPEQVAGNRGEVGPWSDVYAMGVILYEMLSGKAPFAADSMTEVLSRVLSREFAPLRSVRAGLPEAVYLLCERALADAPAARFPHADALREAWRAAFDAFPADVRNATVPRYRAGGHGHDLASAPTSAATASGTPAPGTPPPPEGPYTPGTPGRTGGAGGKKANAASFAATQATPSPVVGESSADPEKRPARSRGLVLGIGGLVAAGALAVVLVVASGERGGTATGDAGLVAAADGGAIVIDATAVVPVAADAAVVPSAPPGMARLPGGKFTMGADPALAASYPDALAQQATEVAPFFLDQHEVTAVAAKAALGMAPGPRDVPGLPARSMTWADAARVCKELGKRLPTEAEWEFAAQRSPLAAAGAQLKAAGVKGPAAVGSHPGDCTTDGVCDLLGNVIEWTADGAGPKRIARGASYNVAARDRWYASIHARQPVDATAADPEIGFRCAADGGGS